MEVRRAEARGGRKALSARSRTWISSHGPWGAKEGASVGGVWSDMNVKKALSGDWREQEVRGWLEARDAGRGWGNMGSARGNFMSKREKSICPLDLDFSHSWHHPPGHLTQGMAILL